MPWEWLVLLAVTALAAAYIVLPAGARAEVPEDAGDALRAERGALLEMLRDLDEDAASGRISLNDRKEGRRALGPRLRAVTEALAALGEPRDMQPPEPEGARDTPPRADEQGAAVGADRRGTRA